MPEGQAAGKNNTGHSIVHGSSHYHSLNMRNGGGGGEDERRRNNNLNNSMDGVNMLNSNDQLSGISRN